jgi:hypothetical protein
MDRRQLLLGMDANVGQFVNVGVKSVANVRRSMRT